MKIHPKFLGLVAVLAMIGCSKDDPAQPVAPQPAPPVPPVQTVVYLIRHAETTGTGADPGLSPAGLQRVDNWIALFQDVEFEAFYSTNYNRTLQTIQPIATSYGEDVTTYDPADLSLADVVADHLGGNVLIVGHSNTVPQMVNAYIGTATYPDMSETDHGNLYKVTTLDAVVSHEMTVHN